MFKANGFVQSSERMVFETRGDFLLEYVYFWSKVLCCKERHFFYFIFGQGKMAVWPSQRNKMEDSGITEPVSLLKLSV